MGQGKSKEGYQKAVKKLSSLELDNIEAVFNELSTKTDDGSSRVELSLLTRQDFAERFHLTGFVAERLFHAFDKTEVGSTFRSSHFHRQILRPLRVYNVLIGLHVSTYNVYVSLSYD